MNSKLFDEAKNICEKNVNFSETCMNFLLHPVEQPPAGQIKECKYKVLGYLFCWWLCAGFVIYSQSFIYSG